jgi:hypothetical protein
MGKPIPINTMNRHTSPVHTKRKSGKDPKSRRRERLWPKPLYTAPSNDNSFLATIKIVLKKPPTILR